MIKRSSRRDVSDADVQRSPFKSSRVTASSAYRTYDSQLSGPRRYRAQGEPLSPGAVGPAERMPQFVDTTIVAGCRIRQQTLLVHIAAKLVVCRCESQQSEIEVRCAPLGGGRKVLCHSARLPLPREACASATSSIATRRGDHGQL